MSKSDRSKDVIQSFENIRDGLDSIWDRFGDELTALEAHVFNFVYDWMSANYDQVEDYFNELDPFPEDD